MADVSAALNSWSTTASSNSPNDNTTIGTGLADNLQQIQATVRTDLASIGSAIASSANPDVGAVTGLYHSVTGNATIAGLGSSATAGLWKIFKTDGTPQFTHSTAMAMPGAANYVAIAGDVLGFMCEASNQWRCMFGSPFAVPPGVVSPYAGTSEPSGWLFCYGQAVSRTTYARLFAAVSTTYGTGDGSTTFNLPDLRGRVVAGQDDMGGSSADRLTNQSGGLDGDTLGATGGSETHTLTAAEQASMTVTGTCSGTETYRGGASVGSTPTQKQGTDQGGNSADLAFSGTISGTATGGGGAHNNVQPTIILNYIIKY